VIRGEDGVRAHIIIKNGTVKVIKVSDNKEISFAIFADSYIGQELKFKVEDASTASEALDIMQTWAKDNPSNVFSFELVP